MASWTFDPRSLPIRSMSMFKLLFELIMVCNLANKSVLLLLLSFEFSQNVTVVAVVVMVVNAVERMKGFNAARLFGRRMFRVSWVRNAFIVCIFVQLCNL